MPQERRRSDHLGALDVPVFLCIVLNSTVRAELAHLRTIIINDCKDANGRHGTDLCSGPDALLDPLRAVLVSLVDELQGLDVCFETYQ